MKNAAIRQSKKVLGKKPDSKTENERETEQHSPLIQDTVRDKSATIPKIHEKKYVREKSERQNDKKEKRNEETKKGIPRFLGG